MSRNIRVRTVAVRAQYAALAALLSLASGCASKDTIVDLPWQSDTDHAAYSDLLEAQRARNSARRAPHDEEPKLGFDEYLRQGDRGVEAGQYADALWSYVEAHRLDPNNRRPHERVGYIQLRQDPAKAEVTFAMLAEEEPDAPEAHTGLGIARLAQGLLEPARTSLERAVELDPDAVPARSALGVVYDRLGRGDEARAQLERALELAPRDPAVLNNLGIHLLGTRAFVQAEGRFREALRQDAESGALRNNLGLALALQGRDAEALAAFRDAGGEQAALNNLGWALYLKGEPERAIERYEQALLANGPDELVILRNLRAAIELRDGHASEPQAGQHAADGAATAALAPVAADLSPGD